MIRRRRKPKDNVISLHGAMPAHGVPDQNTVELLTGLLERAMAGGLTGIIVGWIDPAMGLHTRWEGRASSHDLIAVSAQLHHRIMARWLEGEE